MKNTINEAWKNRADIVSDENITNIINKVIADLDSGKIRVAEKINNEWVVNQWIKKAVLLSFSLNKMQLLEGGNSAVGSHGYWYDKILSKFDGWDEAHFKHSNFRATPGAIARRGSYIGESVVLMPSFINIGAFVDEGTMIDTWTTIGSCAQIGKNCHISGGVGIGGVLEPLQANPVIIEDNCFIGARSEVAEGVIIGEGSVISMGVFIGASTKIIDRTTGEIYIGKVPPYSVVVAGTTTSSVKTMNNGEIAPNLVCAVIVKQVDAKTRSKTGVNDILREFAN